MQAFEKKNIQQPIKSKNHFQVQQMHQYSTLFARLCKKSERKLLQFSYIQTLKVFQFSILASYQIVSKTSIGF